MILLFILYIKCCLNLNGVNIRFVPEWKTQRYILNNLKKYFKKCGHLQYKKNSLR